MWNGRAGGPGTSVLRQTSGQHKEGRYSGKIKITKVDASKNRRLCLNLKVLGLPTFLFYKNGEEVDRLTGGNLSINDIEASLKRIIE